MTGYHRAKQLQFWLLLLFYSYMGLSPDPGAAVAGYSDWLLHGLGYLVAGISAGLALPQQPAWRRAAGLFGYSLAIEIGQHFIPHRGFELQDLAANGTGILLGQLLYWQLVAPLEAWLGQRLSTSSRTA